MIPIKLVEPSPRIITVTEESNELAWKIELDLVEEEKEKAKVNEEAIK